MPRPSASGWYATNRACSASGTPSSSTPVSRSAARPRRCPTTPHRRSSRRPSSPTRRPWPCGCRALAPDRSAVPAPDRPAVRAEAEAVLRALAGPDAPLRPDQWRAIEALVVDLRRVLCVQRTGWGKSAVYFVATALRRRRGAGPTVIVSPLLALMRNHVEAAARDGRRPADQSGTAQQPRLPRRRTAQARGRRRAARGRRGALRLRLGPRLPAGLPPAAHAAFRDRKSTRLNSSHV